ncbi:tRNA modification GTPase MnmE [Botrimarina colliarenosi]|uniref:tRNA modification GTPase MnmE n=1 Tax=Botrimarina colliarenosi TaxID=2528001 RepID=A0A5C6A851_9BACT|nr:GTPase [Botrimarina colliarenosi]TWT95201.1 tRNA modification GTPase MnmE [Botrimarina colliarenosi]
MTPDVADTIAAIATARGASRRGVVRLSGPRAVSIAHLLCGATLEGNSPRRFADQTLRIELAGRSHELPADLFVWPDERSYTRQPAVEFHTLGSPPVLDAVVRACLAAGARLAEPGEFTLRALLGGRIDLTQAEAVLSVIDARSDERLEAALEQLAGGLSTPLHRLRVDLLGLLADLEAGLDFVEEEDIRFVEADELRRRLAAAAKLVDETASQIAERDDAQRLPLVAIIGPPNVGKSRLFNVLVERYGVESQRTQAIVADAAGVTRDTLAAVIEINGLRCALIDTAGDDETAAIDAIDRVARDRLTAVVRDADLLVECRRAGPAPLTTLVDRLSVATMVDASAATMSEGWLATSAATGQGVAELAETIASRLAESSHGTLAATADRCRTGLTQAAGALARALDAVDIGDELVSLELREALDGLGRVVGEVVTDEVLGEIFGKFCIGK